MTRSFVLRGAALVISLALLAWVLADARWRGVGERLAQLDAASLAGITALFAASYAMRAARVFGEFRDELAERNSAKRQGYLSILRLTLIHNALVNVVPFRAGELAFPLLLARWFGVATERAMVSLLWLRAQDACVVLVLAALVWPALPIALRIAAIAAFVAGAWAVPAWARRHPGADAHGALSPGSSKGKRLARIRAALGRSTRSNKSGWFWTIANWSVKIAAEAWLLVLALGLPASDAATGALGAIGAELAAILPLQGVAGFGTFEAGTAALLRTQGVPVVTGVQAALALHAVVLALALAAGGLAAVLLPTAAPAASKSGS